MPVDRLYNCRPCYLALKIEEEDSGGHCEGGEAQGGGNGIMTIVTVS